MTIKQKELQEELVEEMLLFKAFDSEGAHSEADEILLKALRELGFTKLADAYEEVREEVHFYCA